MQIYLGAVFNHFRSLKAWAAQNDAKLALDVRTFELEVKHRGRYYIMRPLFQARVDGQLVHSNELLETTVSFGGWRPYDTIRHPLSTDKLAFKSFLRGAGLPTPASIAQPGTAPPFNYLLKAASGSFGRQIAGPFRAGESTRTRPLPQGSSAVVFAEQFIEGQALKVWFWGETAFFAHGHGFPTITGDGIRTVEQLLQERMEVAGSDWTGFRDKELATQCLRFQDLEINVVLPSGRSVWFDFRYANHYEAVRGPTPHSDNALARLTETAGPQIAAMGSALGSMLAPSIPLPILVTVDAMLDDKGGIWWLEMNTNSVLPPEGYAAMFRDLFG